jgi:hypothetical protein
VSLLLLLLLLLLLQSAPKLHLLIGVGSGGGGAPSAPTNAPRSLASPATAVAPALERAQFARIEMDASDHKDSLVCGVAPQRRSRRPPISRLRFHQHTRQQQANRTCRAGRTGRGLFER